MTWERKTLNQEQRECTDLLATPEGKERQPPGGGGGGTQLGRFDGHREFLRKIHDRVSEPRPAGQDLGKGRLRARNQRLTYPTSMEDNRKNHEKGRGRNANHTHRRQRRGTRAPERKVSSTRCNLQLTKGKMESIKPHGGSMKAKCSQEDHPAIQDKGTEKRKQLCETRREQSTDGKAQARRRAASIGMEKPLGPHNRIPTIEENLPEQRNRLAENPREVEVKTVE